MTNSPVPAPAARQPDAARRSPGQVRSPVVVILLSIITLGIYALFWYYRVFEDLKLRTGKGVGGVVGLSSGSASGS